MENAEHSYRKGAIRIIEEIIEPATAREISGEEYYRIEDEIVAIINSIKQ